MKRLYYSDSIANFIHADSEKILGILAKNNEFPLEQTQKEAWIQEIEILKPLLAANILFRAVQTVLSFHRRGGEKMTFTLEEKFHFLVFKTIGMLMLAQWMGSVGATGLAAYVILVSALFAWMELNPGRFLHLLKVGR